jgi:hypothetical protein
MHSLNDPDPGRAKAVTNADEQDVAVNHSSAEHGYDEPASERAPEKVIVNEKPEEQVKKDIAPEKGPSSQTNRKPDSDRT